MFEKIGPNTVSCDEGWDLEVLGMTGLRYREGQTSVLIDSEVLTKGMAIYPRGMRDETTGQRPSADVEERILDRLSRAFAFAWPTEDLQIIRPDWVGPLDEQDSQA